MSRELAIGAAVLVFFAVICFLLLRNTKPAPTPVIEGLAQPEVYEYVYDTKGVYVGKRLK